jgi:cystathionine beta-lyase/cystathionine gamma-synthase
MFFVRTRMVGYLLLARYLENESLIFQIVKKVYYPKFSETRPYYDHCRTANGGYGGLLSVTFSSKEDSVTFFDTLDAVKGPSLGTNFTLRYELDYIRYPI